MAWLTWLAWIAAAYGAWWLARRLRGRKPTPEERHTEAALGRGIRSASSVVLGSLAGSGAPEFVGPPPVGFEPAGKGVTRITPQPTEPGGDDRSR